MAIDDKIGDAKKFIQPIRSKEQFRRLYLDSLIRSPELRGYFFDGDKRKDDDRTKYLYSELARMLDDAYEEYGKESFENKGFFRRFFGRPLRAVGSALAAASHYLLNVYYSPEAYAVTILPALGLMGVADVIEGLSYLYHNHEGYDLLQVPKLVLESLLEKGLAVIPGYITTLPELVAGSTKFDRAVARKILYRAKNEFIKKFGEYKEPEKQYSLEKIIIPRKPEELRKAA